MGPADLVIVVFDGHALFHVTLREQNRCPLLGAGKIQERVVDADQKIVRITLELPDQRRLANELNYLVFHQGPELLSRDPYYSLATNNLCGSFRSAGQGRLLP